MCNPGKYGKKTLSDLTKREEKLSNFDKIGGKSDQDWNRFQQNRDKNCVQTQKMWKNWNGQPPFFNPFFSTFLRSDVSLLILRVDIP